MAERNEMIELLEYVKTGIKFTGWWPKRRPSLWYRTKTLATIIVLIVFVISQVIQIVRDARIFQKKDLGYITLEITAICVPINEFAKYGAIYFNKHKIADILEIIKDPLFTSHSAEIHQIVVQHLGLCKKLIKVIYLVGIVASFLFMICPLFVIRSEGRILFVPSIVDMNEESTEVYVAFLLSQMFCVMLMGFLTPALNSLIFALIFIGIAQLKVLREKIKSIGNYQGDDKKINTFLIECVKHHMLLEKYTGMLEDTFNIAYLVQVINSCIVCCLIGFNLILLPIGSLQFGRCFSFFVAMMVEWSFLCIPGDEIIRQSSEIADACYDSPWVDGGSDMRKTLFIIMERTKRPFVLTAGKFVDISIPTFVAIMKSAFQFFTVLKQVYAEEE